MIAYDEICRENETSDKMSNEDLQNLILSHNLTLRKCIGFKTPV